MDANIENWWAIKFYSEDKFNHPNEYYQHIYIQGYNAILVNDHLIDIDNNLLYYPYKIESVKRTKYFDKLFEEILNTYFDNQDSYYGTWKQLETFFKGIICNKKSTYLYLAIIACFILQVLIVYIPELQIIFRTTSIGLADWILIFIIAATILVSNRIANKIVVE